MLDSKLREFFDRFPFLTFECKKIKHNNRIIELWHAAYPTQYNYILTFCELMPSFNSPIRNSLPKSRIHSSFDFYNFLCGAL